MNDKPTPAIKRIRTFADDFAAHQAAVAVPDPAPVTPPVMPQEETKDTSPTANPPFHFIRESTEDTNIPIPKAPAAATISPQKVPLAKIPTAPQNSMGGEHVYDLQEEDMQGGTIVREMRSNKFSLFGEIKKSLTGWMKNKEEQAEVAEDEKPKVIAPRLRAETISHAASLGVLPESDDHKKITVRLKEVPREVRRSGVTIEDAASIPKASWSYNESDDTQPTAVAKEAHDAAINSLEDAVAPVPQTQAQTIPTFSKPVAVVPQPARELVPAALVIPQQPTTSKSEVKLPTKPTASPIKKFESPIPSPAPVPKIVEREEEVLEDEAPEIEEEMQRPTASQQPKFAPAKEVTRQLPYVIIVASIAAVVLGGATAFWFYGYSNNQPVLFAPSYQSVIASDRQVPIVLSPQKSTYLSNVSNEAAQVDSGLVIFYPTIATSAGGVTAATMNETLAVLDLTAPGTLARSMTEFTFGSMGATSPFIIISVTNFDAAFGGMLQWERSLIQDVAPFFGSQQTASFVDMVYNNRDLRVAKRNDGSELMYMFLDRTTIIITTNKEVIAEIISRQQ